MLGESTASTKQHCNTKKNSSDNDDTTTKTTATKNEGNNSKCDNQLRHTSYYSNVSCGRAHTLPTSSDLLEIMQLEDLKIAQPSPLPLPLLSTATHPLTCTTVLTCGQICIHMSFLHCISCLLGCLLVVVCRHLMIDTYRAIVQRH